MFKPVNLLSALLYAGCAALLIHYRAWGAVAFVGVMWSFTLAGISREK